MQFEQVFRIGDKLVSFDRAVRIVKQVLELRAQGSFAAGGFPYSQPGPQLYFPAGNGGRDTQGEAGGGNRLSC